MPNIVFIEPQAPNLHIFSQFPLPRLGVLILGTMMKQRGWDVEVYVEDLRRIDFDEVAGSDLVGAPGLRHRRQDPDHGDPRPHGRSARDFSGR